MRQNSKIEDKENNIKVVDKQSNKEVLNEYKVIDKQQKDRNESSQLDQEMLGREQTNVDTFCEKTNVLSSLEKIILESNEREKNKIDDTNKNDIKQRSIDDKLNLSSRTQLTLEEKRKSAPVKLELIEDWTKPVFNKQSSLEEKSRYLLLLTLLKYLFCRIFNISYFYGKLFISELRRKHQSIYKLKDNLHRKKIIRVCKKNENL